MAPPPGVGGSGGGQGIAGHFPAREGPNSGYPAPPGNRRITGGGHPYRVGWGKRRFGRLTEAVKRARGLGLRLRRQDWAWGGGWGWPRGCPPENRWITGGWGPLGAVT